MDHIIGGSLLGIVAVCFLVFCLWTAVGDFGWFAVLCGLGVFGAHVVAVGALFHFKFKFTAEVIGSLGLLTVPLGTLLLIEAIRYLKGGQ